ncbi:MAG TPA: DinB family protein [bacterium]
MMSDSTSGDSSVVFWRDVLWQQSGAAIDMLENAIVACPESVWSDRSLQPEFWYTVYHTLFWLDYYLSYPSKDFAPPAPFNLDEMDPAGLLPERVYTKEEMLGYLEHGRRKCRETITALTEEQARERLPFGKAPMSRAELMLYQLRHLQHHAGQLHMHLRQKTDSAPRWVRQAKGSKG